MVAVYPVSQRLAEDAAAQATRQTASVCTVANINSPTQIVLSGDNDALDCAMSYIKANSRRVITKRLPVSAPFHCSLMQPAANVLASELQGHTFGIPAITVIQNSTATEVRYDNFLQCSIYICAYACMHV
jgi:[acyl-carrier-protein] S-malonyltransferase